MLLWIILYLLVGLLIAMVCKYVTTYYLDWAKRFWDANSEYATENTKESISGMLELRNYGKLRVMVPCIMILWPVTVFYGIVGLIQSIKAYRTFKKMTF